MSKENIKEIKKEDKKSFGKFLVTMILCTLGGGCAGIFMGMAPENITDIIGDMVTNTILIIAPYIGIVLTVITAIVIMVLYKQGRSAFSCWDGEDEDVLNRIEKKLNIAMTLNSTNSIIYYVFMAINFVNFKNIESRRTALIQLAIFIVGFVFVLVVMLFSQQKTVNFAKEINPEKKGSIYDEKFQQKWIESCDEAEMLNIYKSSFASYMAVNKTCTGMWLFCVVAMFVWNIGIVPVCLVGIIWLVSNLSYCLKAMELENKK